MPAIKALLAACAALSILGAVPSACAAEASPAAAAQIEALIHDLETLKDASFIRNASSYDAKAAGKFLRGKWRSRRNEVATPADFIEKVASASSITGRPYLIRFKDGREVKCGDYLKRRLEALRKSKTARP